MSHFTVLVITDSEPTNEVLSATLQPFHEYECTGVDDVYVRDVDRTEEARKYLAEREDQSESAAAAIDGWFGWKAVACGAEPDRAGEHRYGFARFAEDGSLLQAVDRTNPDKKWDWWVVGGRWKGMLRMTPAAIMRTAESLDRRKGERGLMGACFSTDEMAFDICQRADLDLDRMRRGAVQKRQNDWTDTIDHAAKLGFAGSPSELDALRREFYRARRAEVAKWKAAGGDRRQHYLDNMPSDLMRLEPAFEDVFSPRSTDLDVPIETWIDAAPPFSTFAVLRGGKWYERGKMGWWACVSDEKEEDAWESEFAKLLEETHPTHWLTVVDCHI